MNVAHLVSCAFNHAAAQGCKCESAIVTVNLQESTKSPAYPLSPAADTGSRQDSSDFLENLRVLKAFSFGEGASPSLLVCEFVSCQTLIYCHWYCCLSIW